METKNMEITCPACNELNSSLLINCRRCSARIADLVTMQRRISEVEDASQSALAENGFADAFRGYSILLEYKPNHTRYLKGLCRACLGLGQDEYAAKIVSDLTHRIKNDSDINALQALINDRAAGITGISGNPDPDAGGKI
jgi:hypothetical protein